MRSIEQITRAHNLISGVLGGTYGDVRFASSADVERLAVALDVLCWALDHRGADRFSLNLAHLLDAVRGQVPPLAMRWKCEGRGRGGKLTRRRGDAGKSQGRGERGRKMRLAR